MLVCLSIFLVSIYVCVNKAYHLLLDQPLPMAPPPPLSLPLLPPPLPPSPRLSTQVSAWFSSATPRFLFLHCPSPLLSASHTAPHSCNKGFPQKWLLWLQQQQSVLPSLINIKTRNVRFFLNTATLYVENSWGRNVTLNIPSVRYIPQCIYSLFIINNTN